MDIPKDVQDVMDSVSHAEWKILRNHIDAQCAEITKLRRIVSHEHIVADVALSSKSVMVAKLRELRKRQSTPSWVGLELKAIILSAESAEPASIDIEAVREVIYELTRKEVLHAPYVMRCASKLAAAIGDTK